ERLSGLVVPKLFASWIVLGLTGLCLWGVLFAAIYFLIDPHLVGLDKLKGTDWIFTSGGTTLGIACVAFLIVWQIAVHQTAEAFDPLQQSAVDAQAAYQSWQRYAKDEFQRAEQD